jgi:alpha-glucosidase
VPRELDIPLLFLAAGQRYLAEVYRDGEDAHWIDNPYDLVIEKFEVTAADVLELKLAASGGAALRFRAL